LQETIFRSHLVSLKWDAGDDLELQVGGSMAYSHMFLFYLIIYIRKAESILLLLFNYYSKSAVNTHPYQEETVYKKGVSEGRQVGPTGWTLQLDLHPLRQTLLVELVIARRVHYCGFGQHFLPH
jgi:hypothetical protein